LIVSPAIFGARAMERGLAAPFHCPAAVAWAPQKDIEHIERQKSCCEFFIQRHHGLSVKGAENQNQPKVKN
jgi:hypothetical protein